jgi:hypothetical protein
MLPEADDVARLTTLPGRPSRAYRDFAMEIAAPRRRARRDRKRRNTDSEAPRRSSDRPVEGQNGDIGK